jgi:hypothetical protein
MLVVKPEVMMKTAMTGTSATTFPLVAQESLGQSFTEANSKKGMAADDEQQQHDSLNFGSNGSSLSMCI